ncbi:hypothetical protein IKE88_03040 [Candidatus Saccharibacteria bacterium]|nr:hypothetical protein [Candidatus Saccharibacteria bacterium]
MTTGQIGFDDEFIKKCEKLLPEAREDRLKELTREIEDKAKKDGEIWIIKMIIYTLVINGIFWAEDKGILSTNIKPFALVLIFFLFLNLYRTFDIWYRRASFFKDKKMLTEEAESILNAELVELYDNIITIEIDTGDAKQEHKFDY